jgi:hypothetical protein
VKESERESGKKFWKRSEQRENRVKKTEREREKEKEKKKMC